MGQGEVKFSTLPQIFHGGVKLQMFLNMSYSLTLVCY